jgi:SARP family transcriptional regulator, regulator of embCAB operon
MIATAFGALLAKSCRGSGPLRVYLCGSVVVEAGERLVRDSALAGPQGRLLFVFLMSRSPQPVSKVDLVHALWGTSPPRSADTALNAVISKLRGVLRTIGVAEPEGILSDAGTYRLALGSSWVDIDAARSAADRAEGALRRGELGEAWSNANVAAAIARQPFLPDESRLWVQRQREMLARMWRRAALVLSEVSTRNQEYELGIQHALEVAQAEPFDELACQALMKAHAAAGNRAEALRVYARCRKLFRDELGAEPSEKTAGVFLGILRT